MSNLSSAPGTAEIGGKTWVIQKLTRAHVFALYEWACMEVRKTWNPYREVVEATSGLELAEGERRHLLTLALQCHVSGEVPAHLVTHALRSAGGVSLYLALTAGISVQDASEAILGALEAAYAALEEATGASMLGGGRLPSCYWIVAYCRDDPLEDRFYRDLVTECGLTPADIDGKFTLAQLSGLFSAGYTKADLRSMADANEEALTSGKNG